MVPSLALVTQGREGECRICLNIEKAPTLRSFMLLAEREGFEPSVPFPARLFSRQVPSTTRAPLHVLVMNIQRSNGFVVAVRA